MVVIRRETNASPAAPQAQTHSAAQFTHIECRVGFPERGERVFFLHSAGYVGSQFDESYGQQPRFIRGKPAETG